MTTREKKSLRNAILCILKAAEEPLRADEIARRIVEEDLRQKALVHSVNGRLSDMFSKGSVIKPDRALFELNPNPSRPSAEEIRKAREDEQLNNVCAYGLYWERDKVNWNPGRGGQRGLWGAAGDGTEPVDFSNQAGIYVLYNGMTPLYVGRTIAEDRALMTRLVSHHRDDRKGARWDKFSWFGFRRVGNNGQLVATNANVSTDLLITFLEAVMIEAFLPPLNNRGGDLLGTMYEQVEDGALVEKRNADFRKMVERVTRLNSDSD